MKLAGVDLNLMLVFDAMMAERNNTRAGQRIGLSQPAVSHALNRLRYLFRDELFVRTSEGMVPTERALDIAGPIREALERLEAAVGDRRFVPAETEREFVIAAHDVAGMALLVGLGRRLHKAAPRAALRIVPLAGIDAARELEFGTVDLALGPFTEVPERFRSQVFLRHRSVWAMRVDHPLATKEPLTLADLAAVGHLRLSLGNVAPGDGGGIVQHGLRQKAAFDDEALLERLLAEAGLGPRRVAATIPYFVLIPLFLAASDLVVVVPRAVAQTLADHFPLAFRDPPYASPETDVSVVWHIHQDAQPAHRWLRRLLGETMASVLRAR